MKRTRTDKSMHCLGYKREVLFLFILLISLSACGSARSIQGKWQAEVAPKRSGPSAKIDFEFLPDGTFNAMPPGDTAVVDKDKYQLLDDGHTLKFVRSSLVTIRSVKSPAMPSTAKQKPRT